MGEAVSRKALTWAIMRRLLRFIYWYSRKYLGGHGRGRLRFVRRADEIIRSVLKSDFNYVLGHKMYLDSKDSNKLSFNEVYEYLVTELVQKEVKMGNVVLDIGAHIGYYALMFPKHVGTHGKVFEFEPEPDIFGTLAKTARGNDYM